MRYTIRYDTGAKKRGNCPVGKIAKKNSLSKIHSYRLLFRSFCPLGG